MISGTWCVGEGEVGTRLDRAVAGHLDLPRNQIQEWIRAGHLTLNGICEPPKPGQALRAGDRIAWDPPERGESRVLPEAGELALLFFDDDLIVLDKPAGLTVHPGAGQSTGTLAHRLLARFPEIAGVGGAGRPGIVHRLDKGTSGAMVVARTAEAYRALTADFASRRVGKRYLAIVHGTPRSPQGTIDVADRTPRFRTQAHDGAQRRPARHHPLSHDRRRSGTGPARARAPDRTDASDSRPPEASPASHRG